MTNVKTYTLELAGKELKIEIGKMALQTNGSCVVTYGDTVVLVTAVMAQKPNTTIDYFPLMVEYEERMYAAGKIKGSRFIKREGRPTDEAVISGRMIDRALRPLFDARIRRDVQVIPTILSIDGENDSDIPSFIGASCALMISDIPWNGPVSGVRVGQINGEWVLNPSFVAREKSALDFVVAGNRDRLVMLEAEAKEISEETAFGAIEFAKKHLGSVCDFLQKIQAEVGKPKAEHLLTEADEANDEETADAKDKRELAEKVAHEEVTKHITAAFDKTLLNKAQRRAAMQDMKAAIEKRLLEQQVGKDKREHALHLADELVETMVISEMFKRDRRVDGRSADDVRTLVAEVGLLPRTHGSGLFSRGETQVLSVVTLGAPGDEQVLDQMEESGKKHYMHHYNFAPFSVGEARPLRGTGRREIGHGALAEKALEAVLPPRETFPYTIRVVSETLGSNGSSSMASVCGSTLALMDAGVPITRPVAGVAMGLASESDVQGNITRWKVLTDLQDLEDGKGGMDFKVAGTETGITAIQLDTKTQGLTADIVKETLARARGGRQRILDMIKQAIPAPRAEMSPYAPRIEILHVPVAKIREIIGPGGKVINEIIDACSVTIDIEDDGTVFVAGVGKEGIIRAVAWINNIIRDPEIGTVYEGTVTRTLDFGAFVEIMPGRDAMVHVSQLCAGRVNHVTDVLKEGMDVKVKLIEIDDQGRLNASLKAVEGNEELYCKNLPPAEARSFDGPPRHHDRGSRPHHGR